MRPEVAVTMLRKQAWRQPLRRRLHRALPMPATLPPRQLSAPRGDGCVLRLTVRRGKVRKLRRHPRDPCRKASPYRPIRGLRPRRFGRLGVRSFKLPCKDDVRHLRIDQKAHPVEHPQENLRAACLEGEPPQPWTCGLAAADAAAVPAMHMASLGTRPGRERQITQCSRRPASAALHIAWRIPARRPRQYPLLTGRATWRARRQGGSEWIWTTRRASRSPSSSWGS